MPNVTDYDILFIKVRDGIAEQSSFFDVVPDLFERDDAIQALIHQTAEMRDQACCGTLTIS